MFNKPHHIWLRYFCGPVSTLASQGKSQVQFSVYDYLNYCAYAGDPSKSLSNGKFAPNGLGSNVIRRVSMLKSNHAPVNSGDADRLDLDGDSEEDGDEFVSPAILPAVAESPPAST